MLEILALLAGDESDNCLKMPRMHCIMSAKSKSTLMNSEGNT